MQEIPLVPETATLYQAIPSNSKTVLTNRKKYYLSAAHLLQEACTVYSKRDAFTKEETLGILFTFRDCGICDIIRIGFTLVVDTPHHRYAFQETYSSVAYRNDNQFIIHITGLPPKLPVTQCSVIINWISYLRTSSEYSDLRIEFRAEPSRPTRAEFEHIRKLTDSRMICRASADDSSPAARKQNFPDDKICDAWLIYDQLKTPFAMIQSLIDQIHEKHSHPDLSLELSVTGEFSIPVPISCYFDKGFYGAIYFAQKYPVVEKSLSGGKSALQFVVAVDSTHVDMLLYLYYCTVRQRGYYQHMSDEQVYLQEYLYENHPVMKLEKLLQEIDQEFLGSPIVLQSSVYNEAKQVVATYFANLSDVREASYNLAVRRKQTHGKWVNEFKLFMLIRAILPDAEYQYSTDWLGSQTLDIFIPSLNCAIEYQGPQHYQPVEFFGGEEKLIEQERMDEVKRAKCQEKNVTLLEWPYLLRIQLPEVITFLRGYVPEEMLNEDHILNNIKTLPVDDLSVFLDVEHHFGRAIRPKAATSFTRKQINEVRKYTIDGVYICSYNTVDSAAKTEGLSVGGINKAIYGERRTAGGFQWRRCGIGTPKNDILE